MAHFLGLFLLLWIGFADGNIGVATFFLKAAAEVVVAAIYEAGTAFTGNEVVTVFRFNLIATNIAADCISDNHWLSSLKSSLISCA